jgi:hypothetical protein
MEATMAEPSITALPPAPIVGITAPTSFSLPPGPPSYDVIDGLSKRAQDRLRQLRDRRADAHAVMIPHSELQEAIADRTLAEQNLRRLQEHPQNHGFGLPPSDARVIAAEQQVARTGDNARRLQERSEKLAQAWRAASQPLAAVESWLREGKPSGVQLLDYEIEMPKLVKGENGLLDQIENRRRRVRELRADLHRIASAPYPSNHAKAKMRQQIEQLAERGEPSVARLVEVDGPVEFQMQRLRSEVIGAEQRALAFAEVPDIALVAFLIPEILIKRLDALIDAGADDKSALTHQQRQQRESEVMSDLLSVEREESWFVWAAMEQGLPCEHRADCDVRAILQIELINVPRATELPETSPGFSWPWPHR